MADGAYRWQGAAPQPDAARVDAILDAFDEAQAHAFGEPIRVAAVQTIERAQTVAQTADIAEAHERLTQARSALAGLRPEALEPRSGLMGLFDSRGRRLKAFCAAYARAGISVDEVARELRGWIDDAGRRSGVLDAAWVDVRDAVLDLDAHLAAIARRLTGQAPAEGEAADALADRKTALDACRAAAVAALPLLRAAQNTDSRFVDLLKPCAEGAAAWRDDWTEALGLTGRRTRKVRPDPQRLLRPRDDLLARIDRALTGVAAARDRRADIETRLTRVRRPL